MKYTRFTMNFLSVFSAKLFSLGRISAVVTGGEIREILFSVNVFSRLPIALLSYIKLFNETTSIQSSLGNSPVCKVMVMKVPLIYYFYTKPYDLADSLVRP